MRPRPQRASQTTQTNVLESQIELSEEHSTELVKQSTIWNVIVFEWEIVDKQWGIRMGMGAEEPLKLSTKRHDRHAE